MSSGSSSLGGTTTAKMALPGGHTLGSLSGLEVDAPAVRGGSGLSLDAKGFGGVASARGGRLGDIAPLRERGRLCARDAACSSRRSKSKKSGAFRATGDGNWRESMFSTSPSFIIGRMGENRSLSTTKEKKGQFDPKFSPTADKTACQPIEKNLATLDSGLGGRKRRITRCAEGNRCLFP